MLVILAFAVFSISAETVSVGSGSLNVYGSIGSGTTSFTVTQTNTTRYDLLNTAAIQADGAGIVLGHWDFTASNQGSPITYTITYSTTPLTSGSTTIGFEVIEFESGTTTEVVQTTNQTTFEATAGSFSLTRDVGVRLLDEVPSSAPANANYNGSITIALTTET